jgi:hypothetical protein
MLTRMQNGLHTLRKWIRTSFPAEHPTLSAAEQTRLSWAKPVNSYAAVPQVYRDFFAPLQAAGREFPYTVLTPSYEGFIHRSTEKLVCALDQELHILENTGGAFVAHGYPLNGIHSIEMSVVLLETRIKLSGTTLAGTPDSTTLRFNSITDYLLTPIVERIRMALAPPSDAAQTVETARFEQWMQVNYKFMNYARHSLLRGERVVQAILQPEIRTPWVALLGKTYYRMLSPTHVSILTDHELILIREAVKQGDVGKYGGVWDYIPLKKIVSLSLREKAMTCWRCPSSCPKLRLNSCFKPRRRTKSTPCCPSFGN